MNEHEAVSMWKLGWGNMNDVLFGSDKPEGPRRRAIKSDWELHRMPHTRAHFDLGIPLSDDEFETLAWGHIPDAMEDHWFMYFDGEAFCFHRSWTGFPSMESTASSRARWARPWTTFRMSGVG